MASLVYPDFSPTMEIVIHLLSIYLGLSGLFDLCWLENRASFSDWRGSTASKPERRGWVGLKTIELKPTVGKLFLNSGSEE